MNIIFDIILIFYFIFFDNLNNIEFIYKIVIRISFFNNISLFLRLKLEFGSY